MTEEEKMLPCLSIKQPWAWLIVNGHKNIENRDWPTKFRGEFLVHTGKKPDDIDPEWFKTQFGIEIPKNLPLGGIVGKATIVDCVSESQSPWFFGDYGFVLTDATVLPFHPCRGQLGFFKIGGKNHKKEC